MPADMLPLFNAVMGIEAVMLIGFIVFLRRFAPDELKIKPHDGGEPPTAAE